MASTAILTSFAAALCAAVCVLAAAQAAESAPAAPAPRAALEALLAEQEVRAGDPDYDYALGVAALEAGEPLLALDALERVVLHRPAYAGAWLDLAIVHTQLGDPASAEAILAHVEGSFDPPLALRQQIASARAALRRSVTQPDEGSRWHGEVAALVGYTSNANAGIAVGGFSLTPLGSDPVAVRLAADQRPRGDAVLNLRASLYRDFAHTGGSTTSLLGYLRGRQYASETDFAYYEGAAGLSHNLPLRAGRSAVLGGSLRQLVLGGEALATFYGVSAGLRQALGRCMVQGGGEYEYRQYQRAGYFSANVLWGGAGLDCRLGSHTLQLAARLGQDLAQGSRAGGDTTRLEASALWRLQASERWSIDALLYYVRNSDSTGYSPLLENGATRSVARFGQRVSISRAISQTGHWRVFLEAENSRDNSNLPIFRLEERQVSAGLRYLF